MERISLANVNNSALATMKTVSPTETTTSLTTFAETAPEIATSTSAPDAKLQVLTNPYPKQDLQKTLSRKYAVATFTWEAGQINGQNLGTIEFPIALFNIPHIIESLGQLRWINADIQLEIRMNTTPFHIGALMVSWLPRTSPAGDTSAVKAINFYQRSFNNATVMSASSTNNDTIKIPRVSQTLTDPIHEEEDAAICTVYVDVLNQLTLAGSGGVPSNVEVTVFASFVDPEVSGYGYFASTLQAANGVMERVVKHSDVRTGEAVQKMLGGVLTSPSSGSDDVAKIVQTGLEIAKPITDMIGMATQFAGLLGLSKPAAVTPTAPMIPDYFRDLTYGSGLSMNTKLSLKPEAGLHSLGALGFKSWSLQEMMARPQLIYQTKIDSSIATNVPFFTTPITPGVCNFDVASNTYTPTMMAYLSQMFKSWRGSIKIYLQFITSAFTTARIRVAHFSSDQVPTNLEEYAGDFVSAIVDIRGDMEYKFKVPYGGGPKPYSTVVGYYGFDETVTIIPLNEKTSYLTMSLVNPVNVPDPTGSSEIYVNVWISAGDDMTFLNFFGFNQRQPNIQATIAAPRAHQKPKKKERVVKHSMVDKFGTSFPGLIDGFSAVEAGAVATEHYSALNELLHRYSQITISGVPVSSWQNDFVSWDGNDVLSRMVGLFRYYRGGLRYVVVPALASPFKPYQAATLFFNYVAATGTVPDNNLARLVSCDAFAPCSFEIPWMSNTYARSLYTDEFPSGAEDDVESIIWSLFPPTGTDPVRPLALLRSAADDFETAHLLPPDLYSWVGEAVNKQVSSKSTPTL